MRVDVHDIHTQLSGTEILHGISLTIDHGEMVAIVGPNGSGKSTLLRTIASVLKPHAGKIELDGKRIGSLNKRQLAKCLGFLSQTAEIPQLTTVEEHVSLGRHIHRRLFSGYHQTDTIVIRSAMNTCQVAHLAERRLSELSGGERQRVRLATLIAQDPKMMLLDEPLTGLDIEHQLAILELLRGVNAEQGKTVVCVLHDLDLALRYFDRIIVIDQGRIKDDGACEQVLCPQLFDSVFKVDGRIGQEKSGIPVVVCQHPQCLDTCRRDETPSVHVREGIQVSYTANAKPPGSQVHRAE